MDSFIDKFAQRKNAQEMIRANAMAEAEEKEKMASQLLEYEMVMQEMRRCNLQTLENAEKVKELLSASLQKIEEVQKKDEDTSQKQEDSVREMKILLEDLEREIAELTERQGGRMLEILEGLEGKTADILRQQAADALKEQSALLDQQNARMQEMMETQKKILEELLHNSEDFTHKESVKVYRNVQAVIEGALPKQTEEIVEALKNGAGNKGTSAGFKIVWILTLIAALANVAMDVLKYLGFM